MQPKLTISILVASMVQAYLTVDPSRPSTLSGYARRTHHSSSMPRFAKKEDDNNNIQDSSSRSSGNSPKKKKKKNDSLTGRKNPSKNILSLLSNPYQAGKSLRQTLDDAITSLGPKLTATTASTSSPLTSTSPERSVYYLDDRFVESSRFGSTTSLPQGAIAFAQRANPLFERVQKQQQVYIPEVLVIGATTAVGRCIVQRLLLDGRFRVRVLVRDLYSRTLNMFGTGVTYCQGDLFDLESLEYALTDVDKIVFTEGPPRQDEANFIQAFDAFVQETFSREADERNKVFLDPTVADDNILQDLEYRSKIVALRAQLAEQVDCIGLKNLIQAYHNVRHADYGTSQVAKRTLFKFKDGKDDFDLFALDLGGDELSTRMAGSRSESRRDEYGIRNTVSDGPDTIRSRNSAYGRVSSQAMWIKNKFGHGVFTGRVKWSFVPGQDQVSIISSRLRSRENPEKGIDLSNGFSGLIIRICSDGKKYEVFIRTGTYESEGIEYVCEFSTVSKTQQENKSINKFVTLRLPFTRFAKRSISNGANETGSTKNYTSTPFRGSDVQSIGFRFRQDRKNDSEDSPLSAIQRRRWTKFYLAVSYIKAYRSQNDPEFFYLSDARLPPTISKDMIRHDLHRISVSQENDSSTTSSSKIFDEVELKKATENPNNRSEEEIYFKYMGEEIIRSSGLCYAIARISELNELPSGEFSTIRLQQSGTNMMPVSRAEVADVCVSALLDPNASNLCFYVSKSKLGIDPQVDILQIEKVSKFQGLSPE